MRNAAVLLVVLSTVPLFGQTAWERYLDDPTSLNADRVQRLEYTGTESPGRVLSADDLQILQNQVLGRDAAAFRLAVRLYAQSDGAVAESFGVLIGRVVRAQPEFFLRQVNESGRPCSDLAWPLRSTGLEYVDRPEASRHESTERAAALRSVKMRSLVRVKKQCLKVLGGG